MTSLFLTEWMDYSHREPDNRKMFRKECHRGNVPFMEKIRGYPLRTRRIFRKIFSELRKVSGIFPGDFQYRKQGNVQKNQKN